MKRVGLLAVFLLTAFAASLSSSPSVAHPVGFGLLTVKQVEGSVYSVTLRAESESIGITLPDACVADAKPDVHFETGSVTRRWLVRCKEEMVGSIGVTGLSGNQSLWFRGHFNEELVQRPLTALSPSVKVSESAFLSYFRLGMQHISTGWDHLVFLICLIMLLLMGQPIRAGSLKRIGWVVTTFTLGHAVTIALGALQGWSLPSVGVEASIALSVVLMAREAIFAEENASLTSRYPWMICFGFGVLHGFGFSSALQDIGLPAKKALALLGFNLGVELAQLGFVVGIVFLVATVDHVLRDKQVHTRRLMCTVCGGWAMYWFVERVTPIVQSL